ncbi:hypothetical protein TorRG33x02_080310, partial [Trema orientale]
LYLLQRPSPLPSLLSPVTVRNNVIKKPFRHKLPCKASTTEENDQHVPPLSTLINILITLIPPENWIGETCLSVLEG